MHHLTKKWIEGKEWAAEPIELDVSVESLELLLSNKEIVKHEEEYYFTKKGHASLRRAIKTLKETL